MQIIFKTPRAMAAVIACSFLFSYNNGMEWRRVWKGKRRGWLVLRGRRTYPLAAQKRNDSTVVLARSSDSYIELIRISKFRCSGSTKQRKKRRLVTQAWPFFCRGMEKKQTDSFFVQHLFLLKHFFVCRPSSSSSLPDRWFWNKKVYQKYPKTSASAERWDAIT